MQRTAQYSGLKALMVCRTLAVDSVGDMSFSLSKRRRTRYGQGSSDTVVVIDAIDTAEVVSVVVRVVVRVAVSVVVKVVNVVVVAVVEGTVVIVADVV